MVDAEMLHVSSEKNVKHYHPLAIGFRTTSYSPGMIFEIIFFYLLGPLLETERGNTYVLLVVDLCSRHAEGYAMTKEEKTAGGCAARIVDDYIPSWGCPHPFIPDRGRVYFTSKYCCLPDIGSCQEVY